MFERPASGTRALLVQVDFGQGSLEERLAEITLLAEGAGASVVGVVQAKRQAPDPAHFVGKGKADEIGSSAQLNEADIVIFNHVTMMVGHMVTIATIAGAPAAFAVISVLLLTALLVLQIFHRPPLRTDDE